MQEIDLLKTIRPIWIHRATQNLARGTQLRETLRGQLDEFYNMLEQAVLTGDPAWLDQIIGMWTSSMTQTDLESQPSNITTFIKELTLLSFETCRETLADQQAMELTGLLLPCFVYAFEKAAQCEIEARVGYVSNQLKQVQQTLEKLDRSKSDFIAVAAHELKTPLTLVEGYTSMLEENINHDTEPSSAEKQLLEGIHTGARRLHSIIDDMIDVSLIDNNLMSLNFQPMWINRLISVLTDEVRESVKARQLNLIVRSFSGSNDLTYGDPERLLQVFRNILTNAIKFTPDGGEIIIDGRKLPGFIEVTITDSGIGIDPEDQAIIFDKFARLGNPSLHSSGKTKFKGGGPGLGLHIAKGIIDGHGGAIWVESAGHDENCCPGSTFHILIPLRSAPPDMKMAKLFAPLNQITDSRDEKRF